MTLSSFFDYFLLATTPAVDLYFSYEFFKIFFDKKPFFENRERVLLVATVFTAIIFGINTIGYTILNTVSCVFIILFLFIIFKTKFAKAFLLALIYIVILLGAEFLAACLFAATSFGTRVDYSFFVSSPLTYPTIVVIKYLPVLVCRQIIKKTQTRMKTGTFMLYALVPITNLVMMVIIPTFEVDLETHPTARFSLTIYSILLVISICLLFYSFQRHAEEVEKEYDLQEEKMKAINEKELLTLSSKAMTSRLALVEESIEAERIVRHDRRHFEGMLLELLKSEQYEKAISTLESRIESEPKHIVHWCDNETINATIDYYANIADKNDITFQASLNIPKDLKVDSLGLAIALGNLIENAIHANQALEPEKRIITMKSMCKKQLLLSITNPCIPEAVILNEEGYPVSKEEGHGVGTKSVLAFVSKSNSQIVYSLNKDLFTVQLIVDVL